MAATLGMCVSLPVIKPFQEIFPLGSMDGPKKGPGCKCTKVQVGVETGVLLSS